MTEEEMEVENRKYLGPTVKLLRLKNGMWAVLDHNYQFRHLLPSFHIHTSILSLTHSVREPRLERARPVPIIKIDDGDLDL
jgi:hypothetical protein